MVQLYFNGQVVGGAENPTPSVSITTRGNHHPVTGDLKTITTVWRIAGRLLYKTGGDSLDTQVAALQALYANLDGSEVVELKDGGTVLATLSGATALAGLRATPPAFAQGSGVEWSTRRSYSLEFAAEHAAGGEGEWAEFTYDVSTDERLIQSRRLVGVYYKPASVDIESDAATYLSNVFPADDTRYQRQTEFSTDGLLGTGQGPSCRFTVTDTGLWKQLPAGCSYGSVSTSIRKTNAGGGQTTLSGRFVGSDRDIEPARSAFDAVVAPYAASEILSYEKTENDYDGSVSFSVTYFTPDSSEIEYRETVTITPALRDFRMIPVLDNLPAYRQTTVWKPARMTQTGHRIAQNAPSPDGPLWPDDVKDQQFTTHSPDEDINGAPLRHRVDWHYTFERSTTPTFGGY